MHQWLGANGLALVQNLNKNANNITKEIAVLKPTANLIVKNDNELTTCVVVLSGWSLERRGFLERLRGSGLTLIIYAIGRGDPPEDALLGKVKWLRWDTIEKDLMTR